MEVDQLLKAEREQIIAIAAKYGANNLRIFSSIVRGEADEKSDLDLLIDYYIKSESFEINSKTRSYIRPIKVLEDLGSHLRGAKSIFRGALILKI